ncbi:MAG: T9SS type A sorting domain-containing protein [Chitinophagales bacterium]
MTKKHTILTTMLFIALLGFSINQTQAQTNCVIDEFYLEGGAVGVFPLPEGDTVNFTLIDTLIVSEGITPVCQGQPYEFDLTISVPDSVDVSMFADGLSGVWVIDSVVLTSPNDIGLPEGLTFTSNLSNWTFYANSVGCARIAGITNQVGDFNMSLAVNFYSANFLNGLVPVPINFDGYNISVVETGSSSPCVVAGLADVVATQALSVQAKPNPFSGSTQFNIQLDQQESLSLEVYNATGQLVFQDNKMGQGGENTWRFDVNNYQKGLYYYQIVAKDSNQHASGQLIIQ